MAAIAMVYGEQLTDQLHTGDTNFFTALTVSAASWTANAEYVLIVRAAITSNSANLLMEARIARGATPTVFTDCVMILEPTSTSIFSRRDYGYMTKYTAPSPAEDVVFQIRTQDSSVTARADQITILAIRLDADLVEGKDWFFAEDTSGPTQHTTSHVDRALATITPDNANDDWLTIGSITWLVDSASVNAEARIRLDGSEASPTDDAPFISEEGENTAEQKVYLLHRVFTLSAALHTFAVQTRDDATGVNDYQRSAIFGLRLNAFEDHSFDWTEAEFTFATNGVREELADMAFTPTTEGDFVIMTFAALDAGIVNGRGDIRIQQAGTTIPAGDDDYDEARAYDETDEGCMFHLQKLNLAASLQNLDFDGRVNSVADSKIEDRSVVIFSAELAVVPSVAVRRRVGFGAGYAMRM